VPVLASVLRVALVGEESAGLRTLRWIEGAGHRVAAVLTSPPAGAGPTLWQAAEEGGHPLQPAERVRTAELARDLREARADLLLNVHSLHVVHPEVLRAPRIGSFNLHPGPLPGYAGLDAVSWALYHGEAEHGVTVHEMTERIDAGGVAYRASFPIGPDDTAWKVYGRSIREGLALLGELLETAAGEGRVPVEPQDLSRRRYFHRGPPDGGRIDWTRTAREVRDLLRACDYGPFPSPWGRAWTTRDGRRVAVLEAALTGEPADAPPGTVRASDTGAPRVACADEWLEVRTDAGLPPGTRLG
jgi:methionyl-tRNA formyltransferase